MPPIDPRIVKAKRFPVHAAVTICHMQELKRLLTEDAEFHVARKVPDLELSVLHSACSSRQTFGMSSDIFVEMLKYLIEMGAPINDRDALGQTPLHYAVCHPDALRLVTIMTENGAQLDPDRSGDGWTPLHLAAMFDKLDVTLKLLEEGADPRARGTNGETPEDVAKRFKNHALADVLHSPRLLHAPTSFPSQFYEIMRKFDSPPALKFKDEHMTWRDEDGNTILHYAAWSGNIYLARAIFESPKAKNLIGVTNNKGATALAFAIIATQDRMVEEFFMNKTAKKLIDFNATLKDTQETIAHLLLQYAPYVHPKFLLKRKDLTKDILNPLNNEGNTPLLHVAMRNNVHTVRHILANKTVMENKMLELGIKNKHGKTLLHYLVEHKDEENFRTLLDREELTEEIANIPDNDGKTPMILCLTKGSPYMARDILLHPTAKNKFRFDLCHTSDGKSPLHLVAESGNVPLWDLAVLRPDCDFNARDANGNTPLMTAVICQSEKIFMAWLSNKEKAKMVDLTLVNNDGKTLIMLVIEHLSVKILKLLLSTVDAKDCINLKDNNSDTALLRATQLGKWEAVKELLTNPGLKIGDMPEDAEGTVDIHPLNKEGQTSLAIQMTTMVKLARSEQTYNMKKQRTLAHDAKKEHDLVWEIIKIMLNREKELHGTSVTQGRDGGSDCIRKQLAGAKTVRPQSVDELIQEFAKLYQFIKRKKPPQNVPAQVKPKQSQETNERPTKELVTISNDKTSAPTTTVMVEKVEESPILKSNQDNNTEVKVDITQKIATSQVQLEVKVKAETGLQQELRAEPKQVIDKEALPDILVDESRNEGLRQEAEINNSNGKPTVCQSSADNEVSQLVKKANESVSANDKHSTELTITEGSVNEELNNSRIAGNGNDQWETEKDDGVKSESDLHSPESVIPKKRKALKNPPKEDSNLAEGSEPPSPDTDSKSLIAGRMLQREDSSSSNNGQETDQSCSLPSVPARRSKRKFNDASTQTDAIKSGQCICCCTCDQGASNLLS